MRPFLFYKASYMSDKQKRTTTELVNARRIINGPSDMLRAVSATRYPWTRDVWKKMIANTWFVENVSLTRDALEYPELEPGQQQAICRALGFLSNLDSIQVDNLTRNVVSFITDPTIQQIMRRQAAEEDIHVESYSAIVETVIKDPMAVYDLYYHVPQLAAKNDYITRQGNVVSEDPTDSNKVKALVSNMILEGVYFFSGFLVFYTIGRSTGKIQGMVDFIKYIQRDEVTHLELFQLTYMSLRQERPELFTQELADECRDLFRKAAELEASWGHYLIEGGVLGLTNQIITDYVQWLAEQRAAAIGLGGIFPTVKNPVTWVNDYSKINNGQSNFFEAKPQTYSHRKPTFTRSGTRST
jgi:ribonucleoside-diphosphate reductase beta chain